VAVLTCFPMSTRASRPLKDVRNSGVVHVYQAVYGALDCQQTSKRQILALPCARKLQCRVHSAKCLHVTAACQSPAMHGRERAPWVGTACRRNYSRVFPSVNPRSYTSSNLSKKTHRFWDRKLRVEGEEAGRQSSRLLASSEIVKNNDEDAHRGTSSRPLPDFKKRICPEDLMMVDWLRAGSAWLASHICEGEREGGILLCRSLYRPSGLQLYYYHMDPIPQSRLGCSCPKLQIETRNILESRS